MDENREYRASVFSLLFSDPVILRELYNALEGASLPPDVPITINTLEGALYMKRLNDLSFTAGNKLVVIVEHQSTINPNMPLRILMYVARIYEKIVETKDVYAKGLIKIPRPELIVLYNGPDVRWDTRKLKLSDAFEDASAWGIDCPALPLELTVTVYNINPGHNEAILRKSETLYGYSAFIGMIRTFDEELKDLAAAIKKAVEQCMERDILKDFLALHSSEVINMLFAEWKDEEALEYRYREGRNEGKNEDVKNLLAYGMTAGQISEALKLPIDTVLQYQGNK
ncbi:hypothetical protein AGMMS4952_09970 [Spirochaetia bacterium]|nr:hypothetical protein AGMMS4952_09970 [Spirochaetia bacterium]